MPTSKRRRKGINKVRLERVQRMLHDNHDMARDNGIPKYLRQYAHQYGISIVELVALRKQFP